MDKHIISNEDHRLEGAETMSVFVFEATLMLHCSIKL